MKSTNVNGTKPIACVLLLVCLQMYKNYGHSAFALRLCLPAARRLRTTARYLVCLPSPVAACCLLCRPKKKPPRIGSGRLGGEGNAHSLIS